MTHAYDETYLTKAQICLAQMLRYAVQDLGYDIDTFFDYFLQSGVAFCMGSGDYRYTVGMSGAELACEVLYRISGKGCQTEPVYSLEKSDIYWSGWAIAYYQWYSAYTFSDICRYIKMSEVVSMYQPYHEMDIMQFVDALDRRIPRAGFITRLYMYRKRAGLSQSRLAEYAGISVRMVQNYEQRAKDINKAQADTLWKLADVLECDMKDLLELPHQKAEWESGDV